MRDLALVMLCAADIACVFQQNHQDVASALAWVQSAVPDTKQPVQRVLETFCTAQRIRDVSPARMLTGAYNAWAARSWAVVDLESEIMGASTRDQQQLLAVLVQHSTAQPNLASLDLSQLSLSIPDNFTLGRYCARAVGDSLPTPDAYFIIAVWIAEHHWRRTHVPWTAIVKNGFLCRSAPLQFEVWVAHLRACR
jgi:hypothetical protein